MLGRVVLPLYQRASWSVDEVCAWLQSLSEQQEAGQPCHPDDIRAGRMCYSETYKPVTVPRFTLPPLTPLSLPHPPL